MPDTGGEGIIMKLIRIGRRALATLVVVSMLALAGNAFATERSLDTEEGAEKTSPVVFDLFVLRPMGMVGTLIGTVLFIAPVMPLTLITRPGDIGKPFHVMVVKPARYVVADPLGEH